MQQVGYALTAAQNPGWLEALLCERFFGGCSSHAGWRKSEKNIFCADCCAGICQHCVPHHSQQHPRHHCLLQIRRYVYQDVIRLHDIQKLVDCSQVQAYIINGAKVVFLNERPQQRPLKSSSNFCATCQRSLQETYRYCSVACKANAGTKQQGGGGKACEPLQVLSSYDDFRSSCSSGEEPLSNNWDPEPATAVDRNELSSTTETSLKKIKKKKRKGGPEKPLRIEIPAVTSSSSSSHQSSPKTVLTPPSSRRKSTTPHRAPLF